MNEMDPFKSLAARRAEKKQLIERIRELKRAGLNNAEIEKRFGWPRGRAKGLLDNARALAALK